VHVSPKKRKKLQYDISIYLIGRVHHTSKRTSRYFEAAEPIMKAELTTNPDKAKTKVRTSTPIAHNPTRLAAKKKIRFAIWPSENRYGIEKSICETRIGDNYIIVNYASLNNLHERSI